MKQYYSVIFDIFPSALESSDWKKLKTFNIILRLISGVSRPTLYFVYFL